MDGVFQGNLHSKTAGGAIIPAGAQALGSANPEMRRQLRAMNRKQRYLRTPMDGRVGKGDDRA